MLSQQELYQMSYHHSNYLGEIKDLPLLFGFYLSDKYDISIDMSGDYQEVINVCNTYGIQPHTCSLLTQKSSKKVHFSPFL